MSIKHLLTLLFSIAITLSSNAQSNIQGGGAGQLALSHIKAVRLGVDAIYANPAGLSYADNKYAFDLSVERRFNFEELSTYSLGGIHASKFGTFSGALISFGDQDFNEVKLQFGYARKLAKNLGIGLSFSGYRYAIKDFGTKYLPGIEVGLISQPFKFLQIGMHASNAQRGNLTTQAEIPSFIGIGVTYIVSDKVNWMVEFAKLIDRSPSLKTGINYKLHQSLAVALSMDITQKQFSFGVGYNISNFNFIGGYGLHNSLGSTPAVSIQYASPKDLK